MKSIFKFLIVFLTLAFSILLETPALQQQELSLQEYIASPAKESVVLVSNNIGQGEIRSAQEESQYNFGEIPPTIVTYIQPETFLNKNKSLLKGCFIHNLSTNNQKVHQIRAP